MPLVVGCIIKCYQKKNCCELISLRLEIIQNLQGVICVLRHQTGLELR